MSPKVGEPSVNEEEFRLRKHGNDGGDGGDSTGGGNTVSTDIWEEEEGVDRQGIA